MTARSVIVVGSGHPWSLASSYVRAFQQLGARATLFDHYGEVERFDATLRGRIVRLATWPIGRRISALRLIERVRAEQPALVFLTKCDDLPAWVYPLVRRSSAGVRLAAFHPDDPFQIKRLWRRGPSHRRTFAQMRAVDRYFVWSDPLVERARQAGARAGYLGFGVDPEFCHPQPADAGLACDVSFIGTWDREREEWLDALAGAGIALAIWGGPYWRDRCTSPALRERWRGQTAEGDQFRSVVTSSRLNLNILRVQNEGAENMRTYEIPGCGGVMVSNHSAAQERLFRSGREAFYARTPGEMAALIRGLLADREAIERAKVAALEASRAHHYVHRAEQVIQTVFGERS